MSRGPCSHSSFSDFNFPFSDSFGFNGQEKDDEIYGEGASGNIETPGVILNDDMHGYDVKIDMKLNEEEFNKVLNYIKTKDGTLYNLNTFNCTDFAIGCSEAAGYPLPATEGTWPNEGKGSNPGDLGEDIRSLSGSSSAKNENGKSKKNNEQKNENKIK